MASHHLESVENLDRNIMNTPPKDTEATEVRATEEAKGGLKYELVLAEPAAVTPPRQVVSPQKNINLSLDEINRKMREAEERRLSMEAMKLSKISSKFEHLQEVSQKRESFENQFKKAAQEVLVSKMESNKENREKHINSIKEKMKDHERHVVEVRMKKEGSVESPEEPVSSSG